MESSFWKTWLAVGVLSAFGCSSLPNSKPLTYEKAVDLAVAIYNSKAGEDCVYRLLEALAQPEWDPVSENHQVLNFTIRETMCLLEDVVFFDGCDFKENGVSKQCAGYYFFDESPPVIVLSCGVVGEMKEERRGEVEKEEEGEKEGYQAKTEEEEEGDEKEEGDKDQPKRAKRFLKVFKKLKKGFKKLLKKKKTVAGYITS
ncbi:cathelicidin-related peptide Oh-Cath-like [Erythrolamprus reginae]|uniref:cathelicidin-related peptide Oh-Cath-like n=1 Tax=Erythrolamprus reginae TaxID=121349 RepID=UPI00396C741D